MAIKTSAQEVAKYIRDFLNGTGGEWDWDDFTSIRIADISLEAIRAKAAAVDLPLQPSGRAMLEAFFARAAVMK